MSQCQALHPDETPDSDGGLEVKVMFKSSASSKTFCKGMGGFEMEINYYSRDLNTGLVCYLNGQKLSNGRIFHYLNVI